MDRVFHMKHHPESPPISDAFTIVGTFNSTYPLNTQMQVFNVKHS